MRHFGHRLALALGRWDVDALLDEMPRRALLDWLAYHEAEPWGEDRADARAAIVAATVFNVSRGRGTPPRRPRDFMAYSPPKRKMPAEKLALFKSLMRRAIDGDHR